MSKLLPLLLSLLAAHFSYSQNQVNVQVRGKLTTINNQPHAYGTYTLYSTLNQGPLPYRVTEGRADVYGNYNVTIPAVQNTPVILNMIGADTHSVAHVQFNVQPGVNSYTQQLKNHRPSFNRDTITPLEIDFQPVAPRSRTVTLKLHMYDNNGNVVPNQVLGNSAIVAWTVIAPNGDTMPAPPNGFNVTYRLPQRGVFYTVSAQIKNSWLGAFKAIRNSNFRVADSLYCGATADFNIRQSGSSVNLQAQTSDSATSHQWIFGDGTTSTTSLATTSHTYTAPGAYNIIHWINRQAAGTACNDSVVRQVVIDSLGATDQLSGLIRVGTDSSIADTVLVECIGVDDTTYQAQYVITWQTPYRFVVPSNKKYLIYATPMSGTSRSGYMPTYWGQTLDWQPNSFVLANGQHGDLSIDLIAATPLSPTACITVVCGGLNAHVAGDGIRYTTPFSTTPRTYRNSQTRVLYYTSSGQPAAFGMHLGGGEYRPHIILTPDTYTVRPETPLMQSASQTRFTAIASGNDVYFTALASGTITSKRPTLQGKVLTLAPNPSSGSVKVSMPAGGTSTLRLIDALGRVTTTPVQGKTTSQLTPAKGFYTLEALSSQGTVQDRQRLIIQ